MQGNGCHRVGENHFGGCILRIGEIFKGKQKAATDLYVDQKEGLRQVPDDLLSSFGQTESVMVLPLTRDKKLARVEATDVLEAIEQHGYFLQIPPPLEALAEAQITAMVKAEEQLADTQNQEPTK